LFGRESSQAQHDAGVAEDRIRPELRRCLSDQLKIILAQSNIDLNGPFSGSTHMILFTFATVRRNAIIATVSSTAGDVPI
jgi:hypothetical protein